MPVWISSDGEGNKFRPIDAPYLFDVFEEDGGETYVRYDSMKEISKNHEEIVMLWPK